MSSAAARASLGERQAELMRALWARGPVPEGFDAEGVKLEGETLLAKRRRFVAKLRPALARALGRGYGEHFAAYAAAHPLPAHGCADGAAFAAWFLERLGDEDVLERIHWQVSMKALLVSRRGAALSPETKADLDLLGVFLEKIVALRGPGALDGPRLRVALVLGSVGALGLELDRPQLDAARRELVTELSGSFTPRATLLDVALATVRANLAVERVLERVLRPEQLAHYRSHADEDPFGGAELPRLVVRASTGPDLAEALVRLWTRAFSLGDGTSEGCRSIAEGYVGTVSRFRTEPGASARLELLRRREALLAAQQEAERELEGLTTLSEEERLRVERGCGSILLELATS